MEKINICIIGAGRIFQLYHLGAIISTGGFSIKYVVDRNRKTAVRYANLTKSIGLTDPSEVKNCDTFFIATPPSTRKEIFDAIKDKAKFIIFEKPIAFSFEVYDYIKKESELKGITCLVAQTRRFFPNLNFVKDLIVNGFVSSSFDVKLFEGGQFGWITDSNYMMNPNSQDNGVIHDVGAHVYDYIVSLFATKEIKINKIKTNDVFVDYELLPNNVHSFHEIQTETLYAYVEIKLSRSELLANKLIVTDGHNTIISRPLLNSTIQLKVGNKDFNVQVPEIEGRNYQLKNVFNDMWEYIYNTIVGENNRSNIFPIYLRNVEESVQLIDNVIENKKVRSILNSINTFGYEK